MFKLVLLCVVFALNEAAYEGDLCVANGLTGKCINVNNCKTAIQDIKNKKNPELCSFSGVDPIVCCLDNVVKTIHNKPILTTTKRPVSKPVDSEYVPPVYDYYSTDSMGACEAISLDRTSKKTGKKAFDKCIEYQEKYVYPCERGVDLLGGLSRSSKCHHSADDLITGGVDAAQHEFPHMALIGFVIDGELEWLCGATVISERFVITAAHCTNYKGPPTSVLIGALRRSDEFYKNKIYKIGDIILHPRYVRSSRYNDIALIKTQKTIKLDQFVVPACLHTGDAVKDDLVIATGWGLTAEEGNNSEILQKVTLEKFMPAQCAKKYYPVRVSLEKGYDAKTQMCYGHKSASKDTCLGDSGGPIQIKSKKIECMYTIVGVTSFGGVCGVREPGIYTRVAHYVSWIENVVWPN
ncbi:serine protease snake-like [Trichoplusia ni]|uniref:Serine protease snake-like n=1 Tax=Trichoplusia ni TaxID=7111 RepID=A0A7E5WVC5_TRINI|nr:serine protease snake-like [Trichoplusia ni]